MPLPARRPAPDAATGAAPAAVQNGEYNDPRDKFELWVKLEPAEQTEAPMPAPAPVSAPEPRARARVPPSRPRRACAGRTPPLRCHVAAL